MKPELNVIKFYAINKKCKSIIAPLLDTHTDPPPPAKNFILPG
jgi:hypothetical protein